MGKKGRIVIMILATAVLAVPVCMMLLVSAQPRMPVYQGKPLSYWLQGYAPIYGARNQPSFQQALAAVDAVGTNAIPTLLRMLRTRDTPLKISMRHFATKITLLRERFNFDDASTLNLRAERALQHLGPRAADATLQLAGVLDAGDDRQYGAAAALAEIGPGARAAVPALIRAATNANAGIRTSVFVALGRIHTDAESVVPVLITGLNDPIALNRGTAALALGTFGPEAKSAEPALETLLHNPNASSNAPSAAYWPSVDVKSQVQIALRQIDPKKYPIPASIQFLPPVR